MEDTNFNISNSSTNLDEMPLSNAIGTTYAVFNTDENLVVPDGTSVCEERKGSEPSYKMIDDEDRSHIRVSFSLRKKSENILEEDFNFYKEILSLSKAAGFDVLEAALSKNNW